MSGKRIKTEERRNNFVTCVLTDSELKAVESFIGDYNRSYAVRMLILKGLEAIKNGN